MTNQQLKHMKRLSPVMFAGTGSDVGKSVLAAGFCRIFRQDGYSPAPFKAQNMALNSYATPDGLEIGRAQAVQAEAAGIPCHTDMNPLLLKPCTDRKCQVVLHGKPIGNQTAAKLFAADAGREHLRKEVYAAYNRLARRYNPIVLEGAGSISDAKRTRLTALTITLAMACVLAALIYLVRYPVAALYTDDAAVIQMASLLLICEVFYQFPDGIQTNTLCALRGWNDTRAIFCISFIAYWVVSLPLGWILCMTDMLTPEPLGVLGFWVALIVGLSVAALLYLLRIHKLEHFSVEAMKKKIGR